MALMRPLRRVGSAWTLVTLRAVGVDFLITIGLGAGRDIEVAVG